MIIDCRELGLRIRKARLKQNLSQEELAAKCNLTREYVSLIENGHKQPSLETLLILIDRLNVSIQDILENSPHRNEIFDVELVSLLNTCSSIEKTLYLKIICLIKETFDKFSKM